MHNIAFDSQLLTPNYIHHPVSHSSRPQSAQLLTHGDSTRPLHFLPASHQHLPKDTTSEELRCIKAIKSV